MPPPTDTLDLIALRVDPGEGRRFDLLTELAPFEFGGERYRVVPNPVPVRLDLSLTAGSAYVLRLRFEAGAAGACMRCLEPATVSTKVDAREVSQPGGVEELESPYLADGELELAGWAHDALALELPGAIVCRPDCAGLCPVCGVNLARAGDAHGHEAPRDSRLRKLAELLRERPGED